MTGDGSFARALVALKKFLAERDDAPAWLPVSAAGDGAYPTHGVDGGKGKDVATLAQSGRALSQGDRNARELVWGAWL
jgi:hypothetical protein